MDNFTWHKVSENEKEEIQKNANKILEQFASKLDKVKTNEGHFENGQGMRDDTPPWKTEESFKDTMLSNAPDVQEDFIVAEKGAWKK